MSKLTEFWAKICRKWTKIRLQPIRVFCSHHVTDCFDVNTMYKCDWTSMDVFKNAVKTLKADGVEFISITEAYNHICKDRIRSKRYAVISFDDGWATLKQITPWLCEQQIPVTLFLNPEYILGKSMREKGVSLTQSELDELLKIGNGNISIASHGWNHGLCNYMTMQDFENNVRKCEMFLSKYRAYVPFFAYPCGIHTPQLDQLLLSKGIIPVLMDGVENYNETLVIHRELLD